MNPASVLNQLNAESLLENSHILIQINNLRNGLKYKTNGEEISFDDFFCKIQDETTSIPQINLESIITPGTESQYQIQLVNALEKVFDNADLVANRLYFFQSKLRAALQQAEVLEVTFVAWYSIAATEFLEEYKTIRLSATVVKALAQAEFGRLMEGINIDLEALMETTKVLAKQIQSKKSLAQEKYNLGKDQVNAAWTSQNLPTEGLGYGDGNQLISEHLEEDEVEAVPEFVSRDIRLEKVLKTPYFDIEKFVEESKTVEDKELQTDEGSKTIKDKCSQTIDKVLEDIDKGKEKETVQKGDEPVPPANKVLLGEVRIREKENFPEKIHCKVCNRRIRINQLMFAKDDGWIHFQAEDCIGKGNSETTDIVPESQIHNHEKFVEADHFEGFKKFTPPVPAEIVTEEVSAGNLLNYLETTAAALSPPRRKLEILPEDADV